MPRKFLRIRADGYVMNYHPELHANTPSDVFETDDVPPEVIPDLGAYLSGQPVTEVPVKKKAKPEPQFLRNPDGTLATA
jgi:hypothetical protein